MTGAVEVARQTKVQTNGFGMAEVQIAVWLGWKTGTNRRRVETCGRMLCGITRFARPLSACILARGKIILNEVAYKIADRGGGRSIFSGHFGIGYLSAVDKPRSLPALSPCAII